jgi:hypothetical protein
MKIFRIIWYFIVLITLTLFVICEWPQITIFTFFSQFDGKNLIFLIWIIIIVLPLINGLEGFGFKVKSPFAELEEQVNQAKENKEPEQIPPDGNSTYDTREEIETIKKQLEQITGSEVTK